MADNSELMKIIHDAITETAKRPAGLRGPYVFDEAELQAMADRIRRTPVTAEADVSEAEVHAAAVAMADVIARRHGHKDGSGWMSEARFEEARAAIRAAHRVQPKQDAPSPTHRHKKRGTEYVLIGIGKMQAEHWMTSGYPPANEYVDMREVAIYRSVDDGSLWVRPREEFEDGRFEEISK